MKPAITKEILFSYFAGTSTALQKKLIETWVKEEDNRELFFQWLFEWEQKNVQYHVNVDAGIERHRKWVLSLKDHDEPAALEIQKKRLSGLRRWWIAASIVVLCASLGWVAKEKILFREFSTQYGEIKKMTLSDGSKVVLNANSTLKVPRVSFKNSRREVYLTGEASFEVVHTSDHRRFLVHANDGIEVEVLGTIFNVYSRSSGTKIVLEEGKVQLNYKEGSRRGSVVMQPGDLATVDPDGSFRMTQTEQPHQYTAWKYHRFIFDDLPFSEVGQKLEEVFGTRIIIEDKELAAEPVTGSFPALDAEELLDVLKEAKGFSYTRKGNEILIVSEEDAP
ncbi:MAG: hypothetical protein ABS46_09780 [Cytophagaceae bacterium SCN 52-12]|nr:MAG: hypothetical protein ABS46_09780 [Cytophagaceae bacterium SCN 52-12]